MMVGRIEKTLSKFDREIRREVDQILAKEAKGEQEAFADWLHTFYMGGLDGDKLSDFDPFKESPLAADMIADWQHECASHSDRVDLLTHITSSYQAEDFDEPEHFDKEGNPILCDGEPDDEHFDKDENAILPYVLVLNRDTS
jgi:hypothetical protein